MEQGMLELLEKISRSTTFLAVGGTVAVMFLLIFAQSIFGSKTTHSQFKRLLDQTEQMNEHLRQIARSLEKQGENPRNQKQQDSPDKQTTRS